MKTILHWTIEGPVRFIFVWGMLAFGGIAGALAVPHVWPLPWAAQRALLFWAGAGVVWGALVWPYARAARRRLEGRLFHRKGEMPRSLAPDE
jgi:hypothetical protein